MANRRIWAFAALALLVLGGSAFADSCGLDSECLPGEVCCNEQCTTPACRGKADCLLGQTCLNPGICEAQCVRGCTTRIECIYPQICCNTQCQMAACTSDGECSDGDECTIDECINPDSCRSECRHTAIPACAITQERPPQVIFERSMVIGQVQAIAVQTADGQAIEDFTVFLTYPDETSVVISAASGQMYIPIDQAGIYRAIVEASGFEQEIYFESSRQGQIIPPISPDSEPLIKKIFGVETAGAPDYLIIWLLGIAVVSGLIIMVTKVKPAWFRVFMATTYTAAPIVVNYYLKNLWLAFALMAAETLILIAVLAWHIRKLNREAEPKPEGKAIVEKRLGLVKKGKGQKWSEFFKKLEKGRK
ncbi:MAG: ABC transporter permease [Candidatus Diapherotrites archaeon]|uniref:ABC transporter permease n=1 Tax=Candidatus Iainarchaeum sp. TaxID=3101447 RepID=A0A938YSQ1_9ARCH|nr:ABC transporter permease [Candidatus Diapherotrites archaeon]